MGVPCLHRFSINMLKSLCENPQTEVKYFSHFTGFKSYERFRMVLEFVLPDLDRSNIVNWDSKGAKQVTIDSNSLFDSEPESVESSSGESSDDEVSVIIANMPSNFKEKYSNTVVIIDATELRIQTPSSLLRQSQSYSSYKSTNTLKSLVGVDSMGGIIFVSQLYTGSISDKEIVIRSGFLETLKNKVKVGEILAADAVMADKGSDIGGAVFT